jgi:hypothetical protein
MIYLFTITTDSYEFRGDYYISEKNEIINICIDKNDGDVFKYIVLFHEEYEQVNFLSYDEDLYDEEFPKIEKQNIINDIENISVYDDRVRIFKTILEREMLGKILESI